MATTDIVNHKLAESGLIPDSYRDSYKLTAEQGLLPSELAERLQNTAAMRNVIVHLYERVDYIILRDTIGPALRDFSQVVALFEAQLDGDRPNDLNLGTRT